MLWMKAWLETRWRLLYALAIPGVVVASRHLTSVQDAHRMMGAMAVLLMFGAVYTAGAGIRTQPAFSGTKNLHGSMYYTLSLPVSRLRLLAVRAGAGLLETAGSILILISACWLKFPLVRAGSTPVDLLELVVAAIVCTPVSTLSRSCLRRSLMTPGKFGAAFLWSVLRGGLSLDFRCRPQQTSFVL